MKIFYFKRIVIVFSIFFVLSCALDSNKQAAAPSAKQPQLFYGPENSYYYFTSAQVQRIKGNLDKAVVLLRKAIALDPNSFYLQRELATVYLQNREDDKAIEVFEQLIENPNCEMRWIQNLAMIYIVRQKWGRLKILAEKAEKRIK